MFQLDKHSLIKDITIGIIKFEFKQEFRYETISKVFLSQYK